MKKSESLKKEIENWEHAKELHLNSLKEELKKIRKFFGHGVVAQRRRWLKERIKICDEQIKKLKGEWNDY